MSGRGTGTSSKPKGGGGGVAKNTKNDKKDTKAVMETAKAQEAEEKALHDPDVMESDDVDRKRKTEQKQEEFLKSSANNPELISGPASNNSDSGSSSAAPADAAGLFVRERGKLPAEIENSEGQNPDTREIKSEPGEEPGDQGQEEPGDQGQEEPGNQEKEEPNDQEQEESEDDVPSDEEEKWSPSGVKKKGLGIYGPRVEGLISRWGRKMLLVADGPKNASNYRLYKPDDRDIQYLDESSAPILRTHERIGEQTYLTPEGEKKFRYGKGDAKLIQGVAYFVDREILLRFPKHFPRPVDLVKPKIKESDYPIILKTEDKIVRMSLVDCLVKIKWLIGDKYESCWESRNTARRVWRKKRADQGIFEAALQQERIYEKWLANPETGRDRSATPWALGLTPTPERDLGPSERGSETPGLVTDRESSAESDGPSETELALKSVRFKGASGEATQKSASDLFKESYMNMMGFTDIKSMKLEERDEMLAAWERRKGKTVVV